MRLQCFCDGLLMCHEYNDHNRTFGNTCIAKEFCFSLICFSLALSLQLFLKKDASQFFFCLTLKFGLVTNSVRHPYIP